MIKARTDNEIELTALDLTAMWSIQPGRGISLDDFTAAVFSEQMPGDGRLLTNNGLQLLRPWPHQAYLIADQPALPSTAQPFVTLVTDIADAFCAFRLDGEAAGDFLADYLSADITAAAPKNDCLRCRLGHYTVLLWWQDRVRLQLLVERSLAQSFTEYIKRLLARRQREQS